MTLHCAVSYFDGDRGNFGYIIGSDSNMLQIVPTKKVRKYLTLRIGGLEIKIPLPVNVTEDAVSHEVFVDKSFQGKNYVGFPQGSFFGHFFQPDSENPLSLDDLFSDSDFSGVQEGSVYPDASPFRYSQDCTLLIASKTSDSVGLYAVTREEDQQNRPIARRIHGLTLNSSHLEKESLFWYRPDLGSLVTVKDKEGHLREEFLPDLPWYKTDPNLDHIIHGYMQGSLRERLDFSAAKNIVSQSLTTPSFASVGYTPGEPNVYCINPNEIVRL